jgi:hypothetical protein
MTVAKKLPTPDDEEEEDESASFGRQIGRTNRVKVRESFRWRTATS